MLQRFSRGIIAVAIAALIGAQLSCVGATSLTATPATPPAVTPVPLDEAARTYYELAENHVSWYLQMPADGGVVDILSQAVTGYQTLPDGTPVYNVETTDINGSSLARQEITNSGAYLHTYSFQPSAVSTDPKVDFDFAPALEFMRFPLADGDEWLASATLGGKPVSYTYKVSTVDSVELTQFHVILANCFRVTRTVNGTDDEVSTYCPIFGLVKHDIRVGDAWSRGVMFDWVPARTVVQSIKSRGLVCEIKLQAFGFRPDEHITARVRQPENSRFADGHFTVGVTGSDAARGFSVLLAPELMKGTVVLELTGQRRVSLLPDEHVRALALLRPDVTCGQPSA